MDEHGTQHDDQHDGGRTRRGAAMRPGLLAAAGALVVGSVAGGGVGRAARAAESSPSTSAGTTTYAGPGGAAGSNGYAVPPRRDQRPAAGQDAAGQDGAGSADDETSDATDTQETGLVEISSTLANGTSAGTGMVLTSDGEVVTNHHVVAGATRIKVTIVTTGQTYTARYVGASSSQDVAVLQLQDASGLTTVDTDAGALATGDDVTSVGDAGGDGGSLTAAPGTVSAQDQAITVSEDDGSKVRLSDLIEVDADVVPGDSGGALLDSDGDVVGMNVAASSGSADVTGYAIPISTVLSVADRVEQGDTTGGIRLGYSGYLGVALASTTAQVAEVVEGSAAAEAGLTAGDTVRTVDGVRVRTADQLRAAISDHAAGDRVTLTWTTAGGASRTATATLGSTIG